MRKVCVVIGSRANYSSIKSVMRAVDSHPDLCLQVIGGASAVLDRYGRVVHYGTFNASPLSAAAGIACLQEVETGEPTAKADSVAAQLRNEC